MIPLSDVSPALQAVPLSPWPSGQRTGIAMPSRWTIGGVSVPRNYKEEFKQLIPQRFILRLTRAGGGKSKAGMLISLSFLTLACCSKPAPVAVVVAPVGHIYPTTVQMPLPTSHRVKITPQQGETYQQAFNIIGLKVALMIGALTCGQNSQYDAFMTAFQPHILAEQQIMDNYFHRLGGSAGRSKEDAFETMLANNLSVSARSQGSLFCLNSGAEFKAVLTLSTPQALDSFVTDQAPPVP